MRPLVTMREALADPALLGHVLNGESWLLWRTILTAAMGEPLTADERELFTSVTGRSDPPARMVEEAAMVVGRRGGKDRAASVLLSYIAGLCEHPQIVPGERGVALCVGADLEQSSITLGYVKANFEGSPVLSGLIRKKTEDGLELLNGIDIVVRAASFRRLRGMTSIVVIATETAFWYSDESANPDAEILNALRPSLSTTGGPLWIISSPYARRGELYNTHRRHFGPNGDPLILVAQGASRTFNPTLSEGVVLRALERDPAAAGAEYLAQFRTDVESLFTLEAVEACVTVGLNKRPPVSSVPYVAFVDPSGGSSDSMTLAIAHREKQSAFIDCVLERKPPFAPSSVVRQFVELLRSYRITRITGDRYAGEWAREPFRQNGVDYFIADKTRSDLYLDLLPHVNGGNVQLTDDRRVVTQLVALERRTARSGKDAVNHPPGGHDDCANVIAGAVHQVLSRSHLHEAEEFGAPRVYDNQGRRLH